VFDPRRRRKLVARYVKALRPDTFRAPSRTGGVRAEKRKRALTPTSTMARDAKNVALANKAGA